jgi:hypothetical protein
MRSDMAKVIVERPRHGPRQKYRKGYRKLWQKLTPEDWPHHESIYAKGRSKFFNEHLGPLRRYLRKQVGRPWNKVFSEICQNLRVDSAVQSHVRDHLEDFVETRVIEIDGVLCSGKWPVGNPLRRGFWKEFYVCPRTGLLRAIRSRKFVKQKPPVERIKVDESSEYRLMNGIWYEVILRPITHESFGQRDIVLQMEVSMCSRWEAMRTYGAYVFAARRRQLNKREIRRLNLRVQS